MDINLLKKLGFSEKSSKIYLSLLRLGPSSVRKLAESSGLNRGTTYDTLKWLKSIGVVNYYNKDTKQIFVAEDPTKLHKIVRDQKELLDNIDKKLERIIPELNALHNKDGERPVAKYYDKAGVHRILQDVLNVCDEQDGDRLYRIYSAEGVRECLYENFSTFSDVRIAKNISVKVIAMGEGGETRGLDERKWLNSKSGTPTYIIIYPGKTAYISLNAKDDLVGVVIENEGVYQTQKIVFDSLWDKL
jgi:DNA-binding transcriptional regulator YhcF (GntR family)